MQLFITKYQTQIKKFYGSFLAIIIFIFSTYQSNAFIGNAQSGINETYAILYHGGANNTYYDLYATTTNVDFQGANLGTFNCTSTLLLKGGQSKVFKCSGGDITNSEIFYRIYKVGNTPGVFSSIGIGYSSGFGNGCGGADQTWETANSTINILAGLTAGNYNLEVYTRAGTINNSPSGYWLANNSGNNYIANFTVVLPQINAFANQALCFGQTGSIAYTTSGGNGAISVTQNTTPVTSPITNLAGGIYTLIASDALGCTATSVVGIANVPTPIVLNTTVTQPICTGDLGQIVFASSGGTGAKNVTWGGGTVTSPMSNLFGFTYVLTVTDANFCTISTSIVIVDPNPLQLVVVGIAPTCNGQLGQISGGYSGGTGSLNFTINGATYVTNYAPGTYTATVTDAVGCSITDVVTITGVAAVVVNASASPIQCSGGTTNVTTSASGGTGLITITPSGNPFIAGTYTFTAMDANACVGTTVIAIANPIPFTIGFNVANNTIYATGAAINLNMIVTSGTAGSPAIIYGPSSAVYNTPPNPIIIATAATSGIYTVTCSDLFACTASATVNIIVNAPTGISISPKVFLDGAYQASTGMMHDSLRIQNLIPIEEPYSSVPYSSAFTHIGGGAETIGAGVLATTGANAIVDWVFVSLRSFANPLVVIATKSGLLQRDGDVVSSIDGTSPLLFTGLANTNYYISIQHRNHLGVMTASALALSNTNTVIDFTSVATPLYLKTAPNANPTPLSGASKLVGGVRTLYAGNCKLSPIAQTISYGYLSISDRAALLLATGGTSITNAYSIWDVNMNGSIKFLGMNNDKDVIKNTCANGNTSIIVHEQLP